MNELELALRSDVRKALVALVLITAGGSLVYLAACYRRAAPMSADELAEQWFDALERRELMREAAERDAPPEA